MIGQVTSVNEESAYKSVNVHPIANLHNLDIVQVLTAGAGTRRVEPQPRVTRLPARRGSAAAAPANSSPRRRRADERLASRARSLLRLAALALVVVFFQIGVVSEVPVFGVNVDLSPLLVAFVGPAVRLHARGRRAASRSGCSSTSRCCRRSA